MPSPTSHSADTTRDLEHTVLDVIRENLLPDLAPDFAVDADLFAAASDIASGLW